MRRRLFRVDGWTAPARVGRLPVLGAALLGVIDAFSFAPSGHALMQLGALALFSMVLWRAAARGAGPRGGALLGFVWAFAAFTVGVSWLFVSMHDYGGMPAPLALLALLAFCAYLAIFPAAACALALAAWRPDRPWTAVATLAGSWALTELLRGWLFTGFPWLSTGYAQIDGPFASVAPWLGVHGVSLVTLLCAGAIGLIGACGLARRRTGLAGAFGCAGLALGLAVAGELGAPGDTPVARLRVGLLQGNVPQDLKFDPARTRQAMLDYVETIGPDRVDLTVLPETAWTIPWSRTPADVASAVLHRVQATGGLMAIGMPLVARTDPDGRVRSITNSVAVLDSSGNAIARYDKRHLVPFGEFVPWGFRWFVNLMNIPLGDFGRGSSSQTLLNIGRERIAFNICYEDLFGHELAEQVRQGATVLINATNIAWFGRSHALGQHLQIARMRSLELARPMLRSTNTGVTAAIDHRGRVLARLPDHTRAALVVEITGQTILTPFARWGQWGIALVAGLLTLCAGALAGRRRP